MARINIDDSIYQDSRFHKLIFLLNGDTEKALGALIRAWSLAQKWFLQTPDHMIPLSEWKTQQLNDAVIQCGLAQVIDDDRVRVSGIEKYCDWLLKLQKSGKSGGIQSGKARREIIEESAKQLEAKRSKTNPLTLSLTLTPNLNLNNNTKTKTKNKTKGSESACADIAPVNSINSRFIAAYVLAYKRRYGEKARPDLSGKIQRLIKIFLADTPPDRALALIEKYCEMGDQWFLTKAHDFVTFTANLSKVGVALDTGKSTTQAETKNADKVDTWREQARRIAEGTL